MHTYEYLISVIIPVIHSERVIGSCLESIYNQNIDKNKIQVIVVDADEECSDRPGIENYIAGHRDMKIEYHSCECGNRSRAKNRAREYVKGKYVLFMEPEDTLNRMAIGNIVRYFESCADSVDVVISHMNYISSDGVIEAESEIYKKYLINTGIYCIEDIPITLANIMPCIKAEVVAEWDENIDYHEDKLFFFKCMGNKTKFGYMKEAQYNKSNDGDEEKTYLRTFKMLSETILMVMEKIVDIYDFLIPYGAQGCIMEMLHNHVMLDDSFWPHQYGEKEYKEFENRVKRVLYYIDTKTIINQTSFDKYEKSYWLNLKPNICVSKRIAPEEIGVYVDGFMLESRTDVEWTLRRICVQNDVVTIYGDFKLALFDFLSEKDKCKFAVLINEEQKELLDVKLSFAGYPRGSRILMNKQWAFSYTFHVGEVNSLEPVVVINGVELPTRIVNCYNTVFGKKLGLTSATVGNVLMKQFARRYMTFQYLSNEQVLKERKIVDERFVENMYVYNLRKECAGYIGRRIWLYNDNFAMINNGYYLFSHNVMKDDGIEHYYIIKDTSVDIYQNADEEMRKHFLLYGSHEHILCFLNAEKIFTAFTSGLEWRALQHNEMFQYWDIFRAEVILLSHGVLNQFWPWSFSPIRMPVDKVVVSAKREAEAWSKNGFWEKDFIYSGMPRYEIIKKDDSIVPKRKIVVALSWRMYLAGKHEILLDAATPRVALDDRYTNSSYFKNFMNFLNDERLQAVFEEYDVEMDVNLHPQFNLIYRNHMNLTNDRVHLTSGEVNLSEYSAMISDVSSIIFDFAVFKRPIQYFIPDIVEFKAGCNHFREVVIPFEDGLGPYATDVDGAVENLIKLIKNDFKMDKKYSDRLDGFHVPLDCPCEKIYQYCINE